MSVIKSNWEFIGVTGTNGKTSCVYFIYQLLKKLGQKASLIGTINCIIDGRTYKSKYTTPPFSDLRKLLNKIESPGRHFVVIEVSSHGIAQERIRGLKFSRIIFTNLTRDHLDYHHSMKDYFNVKRKLFLDNRDALAIINNDDPYGRKLLSELNGCCSYGISSAADFRARNLCFNQRQAVFDLCYKRYVFPVNAAVFGRYNVLNILAAVSTLISLKFDPAEVSRIIPYLKLPKGRLQRAADSIFVDYAHTPDALKNTLKALRLAGYKKIICVFGCGGDRDRGKRKIMGRVAWRFADFSIITSDNPRSESALDICREIEQGVKGDKYSVVVDRRQAIAKAVNLKAKHNDCCVLVAGKGHERYQIAGNKRIPFDDVKMIRDIMV